MTVDLESIEHDRGETADLNKALEGGGGVARHNTGPPI